MKTKKLGIFANVAERTHAGDITKMSAGPIGTRHLLGKLGANITCVEIANAGDLPFGVITDEAEKKDDPVNVAILGVSQSTLRMVAAENIVAGRHVYAADNGKVRHLPSTEGTYLEVGLALTNGGADQIIEVASCLPRKVLV